jgi:YVTN family beta-propeller protein
MINSRNNPHDDCGGEGMTLYKRAARTVFALIVAAMLVAGCGDQFRPTVNFLPTPSGDSTTPGQAVILSTNPSGNGSDTHINVSGDTNVGEVTVGPNPLFLLKANGRALVINSDNTITAYAGQSPLAFSPNTIVLPGTVSGAIAGGASRNGNVYITNSGSNDVDVIPSAGNIITSVIPVGARPVMVAANANSNVVYVVNHDDNTVTLIGSSDNAVLKTIPVGAQPIWAVMSDDGVDVFVVNQGDGTLSVIDTTLNIVFTTINLNGTGPSAALGSNFAFYDNVRKRVYVTNPGDNSVSVIKADSINLGITPQIVPTLLAKVPLSGSPLGVAAIADGTRAYAVLAGCPAGTNHTNLLANLSSCNGNQVSVIDAVGLRESRLIPVGAGAVSIAASTDGTKVYTANAHDGNMSIIKTSTDSELMRMAAPQQNLSCSNPSSCPSNVTQTPFQVITFP